MAVAMALYLIVYKISTTVVAFNEFLKARQGSTDSRDDTMELFQDYASYQLGNWFTYSSFPGLRVLVGIFVSMVLLGTMAFVVLAKHGVAPSLYQIFVWLVAPDGGALESTTGGLIVGAIISLNGLLLFALLMTVVGAMFDDYIASLKAGSTPVLETEHTVILGFTDDTIPLVQELCNANEDSPVTIAILSELPKPEVEQRLDDADLLVGEKLKGSRVVVRTGFPHRPEDLKLVSTDLCRTAIPMPERTVEKELRDAYMLQVVAAVTSGEQWLKTRGKVLIFYSVDRNSEVFAGIGGEKAATVNLDGLISSVLVSCSNQKQTSKVISELLSFAGSELHFAKVPKWLHGKRLDEIELHYPNCTIVGLMPEKEDFPELCPVPHAVVEKGLDLIVLAEDTLSLAPTREPQQIPETSSARPVLDRGSVSSVRSFFDNQADSPAQKEQEYILVVGWSYIIGSVMAQLDSRMESGTTIASFANTDPGERNLFLQAALKRHRMEAWGHIEIEFYQGQPGSSYQLEEAGIGLGAAAASAKGWHFRAQGDGKPDFSAKGIPWSEITRVFVLADHTAKDPWRSDAICISTALQARKLVHESVPLVVETLDVSSREVCERLGIQDVVSSATLPAKVMATLSLEPRLKEVLLQLLALGNYEIHLAPIRQYWTQRLPMETCFHSVACAVRMAGDLLVGWATEQGGGCGAMTITYNPHRFEKVVVDSKLTLVVVACRAAPTSSRRRTSQMSLPEDADESSPSFAAPRAASQKLSRSKTQQQV